MVKDEKTATVKIPADVWRGIQELKKTRYYDRPYVDIYRDLMRLGLEAHYRGERLRKEG